ncbi:hypothetical protein CERSUDRAFT_115804 [Gelatoporia subvermispora B]|uniref:Uncharacterized protein n=1 Tax=Ceriporiopsis subvermispora (strain B) TaxID=914234 RepID=M2QUY7_CERS8|nr:hypothetical protein CERSUDRAFT_115804 [Gelatoporia subvermispora B]
MRAGPGTLQIEHRNAGLEFGDGLYAPQEHVSRSKLLASALRTSGEQRPKLATGCVPRTGSSFDLQSRDSRAPEVGRQVFVSAHPSLRRARRLVVAAANAMARLSCSRLPRVGAAPRSGNRDASAPPTGVRTPVSSAALQL